MLETNQLESVNQSEGRMNGPYLTTFETGPDALEAALRQRLRVREECDLAIVVPAHLRSPVRRNLEEHHQAALAGLIWIALRDLRVAAYLVVNIPGPRYTKQHTMLDLAEVVL